MLDMAREAKIQQAITRLGDFNQRVISRQSLYPFEDILDLLSDVPLSSEFHVITRHKKFFSEKARHEHEGFILLPHFSVSLSDNEIHRHTNHKDFSNFVAQISRSTLNQLSLENVTIFFSEKREFHFFKAIAKVFNVHFQVTSYDEILHNAARRYRHIFFSTIPPQEVPTIQELIFFINTHFSIDAFFFQTYGNSRVEQTIPPSISLGKEVASHLASAATFAVSSRRKTVGKITSKSSCMYYCSLPALGLIRQQSEVIGALVLLSSQPLPLLSQYFVQDIIDEVLSKRLAIIRAHMITELMSQVAEFGSRNFVNASVKRRDKEFRRFAAKIVNNLYDTTNAHSCTIRVFDHYTQSLKLVAVKDKETAKYDRSLLRKKMRSGGRISIPIRRPFVSINAFCFANVRRGEHIYIRDIENIDQIFKTQGLQSAFKTRQRTVSEFTIPLYWGMLRIGVLNLEAEFPSAFEADEGFINTASFLVSQAWALIYGGTDRYWLSQVSFTHLATHELIDFRRSLGESEKKQFDRVVETLTFSSNDYKEMEESLFDIQLFAQSNIKELCPYGDVSKIIKWPKELRSIKLSAAAAGALRAIFDCMVRNAAEHSNIETDLITTSIVKAPGRGKCELLITYESRVAPADPDDASFFFYRPLRDADGLHFGLFLIGAHVRLIGGHVSVSDRCLRKLGYGPLRFAIRIPHERQ